MYISSTTFIKLKKIFFKSSRVVLDRKKLEPIKLINMNNTMSHVDSISTGQSLTEDGQNPNINDEELSVSENTLSTSDKQMFNNPIRGNTNKKKVKFNLE